MSTDLAYITPPLVTWAIKRSGLDYSKIEEKLKVNRTEIIEWEKGKAYPTFSKAVSLSDLLRIPFGYFFLSKPPETDIPLPDLRTLTGNHARPARIFGGVVWRYHQARLVSRVRARTRREENPIRFLDRSKSWRWGSRR